VTEARDSRCSVLPRCDGRDGWLRGYGKKLSQGLELSICTRCVARVRRRQESKLVVRLHVLVEIALHLLYLGSISLALKMTIRKAWPYRTFALFRGGPVYYYQPLAGCG
jgi:hypothetical protein